MSINNKATEAILQGNIKDARTYLNAGGTLSGSYFENNVSGVFRSIFNAKAFDLIDFMIKEELVITDVYELESFDKSVFKHISQNLQSDEDSIGFLESFLQKVSNLNDEVNDQTVLSYCMAQGAAPVIIKCLIDAGCDVRYKNNAERNLIHCAVCYDPEKANAYIKLLLDNGVDPNEKDITGATPLLLAVQGYKRELIPILLENGANANDQDNEGNSSFFYAVCRQMDGELYDILSAHALADFSLTNRKGETLLTEYIRMMGCAERELKLLTKLVSDGADLRQTGLYYYEEKSALDWIVEKKATVLRAVLDIITIDIDEPDNRGNTLLHKVCACNVNFDTEAAREVYKKVKLLLDAGGDASITNDKNETPIMLAQEDNLKVKTVELLMSHGL
jgi:uncharacterized protein